MRRAEIQKRRVETNQEMMMKNLKMVFPKVTSMRKSSKKNQLVKRKTKKYLTRTTRRLL
jgi:hypothetical protein